MRFAAVQFLFQPGVTYPELGTLPSGGHYSHVLTCRLLASETAPTTGTLTTGGESGACRVCDRVF